MEGDINMLGGSHQKVTIIGSGPAGLTAGIYAARAGLKPVIVADSLGQLETTSEVENFPGAAEGSTGPELLQRMKEQAESFGARFISSRVAGILTMDEGDFGIELTDPDGTMFSSESVILATGASARWLGIEGEERLKNRGVSACATCDGPLRCFRNQHIVVVGGGDSAMEEALFLTKFASQVTIIHRRDSFRASQIMQSRVLSHPKIKVLWNSAVVQCNGQEFLESVNVKNTDTGSVTQIPCAGLFVAIGHEPNTKFTSLPSGVSLDSQGYVVVLKNGIETGVPGFFAAGDVHDSTFRQAISAAGFGCMAAIACERWLESREERRLESRT